MIILPRWMVSKAFLKSMKVTTAERVLSSIPSMIRLNTRICSVVDLFSLKPHWFGRSLSSRCGLIYVQEQPVMFWPQLNLDWYLYSWLSNWGPHSLALGWGSRWTANFEFFFLNENNMKEYFNYIFLQYF